MARLRASWRTSLPVVQQPRNPQSESIARTPYETTAIPALIERLAEDDGLKGALVSIDAIATNTAIAGTIRRAGADYLLAVKANQPTLRSEVEALFAAAEPAALDRATDLDKGHGRIEERTVTVARDVDWLEGARRFPGELRLPDVACVVRVCSRTELKDRCRFETRYYISSAPLTAAPPKPCAGTGALRTTCTGSSTSSSATTSPACARVTAPTNVGDTRYVRVL